MFESIPIFTMAKLGILTVDWSWKVLANRKQNRLKRAHG